MFKIKDGKQFKLIVTILVIVLVLLICFVIYPAMQNLQNSIDNANKLFVNNSNTSSNDIEQFRINSSQEVYNQKPTDQTSFLKALPYFSNKFNVEFFPETNSIIVTSSVLNYDDLMKTYNNWLDNLAIKLDPSISIIYQNSNNSSTSSNAN